MYFKALFLTVAMIGVQTVASSVAVASDQSASLLIEVTNIQGAEGRIVMALYDNPKSYSDLDEDAAYAAIAIRPNGDKLHVRIDTLAPGDYAVVLFYDVNNNGQFDFKGETPLEGYGISGAKHAFDEPNFKNAKVAVRPGNQTVVVKMHYFQQ